MKVFALLMLALCSVSARGSGPYLPSGWRPDGPAFYLPTQQFPSDNPLKDLILQGSEASASDSLREYGPPKVSQEVIKQNLPKDNIALAFIKTEELQKETLQGSEVSDADSLRDEPTKLQESPELITQNLPEITEQVFVQRPDGISETTSGNIKAQEETVTKSQAFDVTTLEAEVPVLIIQDSAESIAFNNAVENEVTIATETTLPVDLSTVEPIQNIYDSISIQNVNEDSSLTQSNQTVNSVAAIKVELEQTVQQFMQSFEQSLEQVEEKVNKLENIKKVEKNAQKVEQNEQSIEGNVQIEQNAQIVEDSVQNIEKNVEQAAQNGEENSDKAQDGEQVVQNLPEVLTYVNNEITQQVEKTDSQNEVSFNEEFSGSLEHAPEGFLEYGPPGFKEYGPPKEDELARETTEKLISEVEPFESTNEARRRRFSPKFRLTKNQVHH